jgi:hypothetical protein
MAIFASLIFQKKHKIRENMTYLQAVIKADKKASHHKRRVEYYRRRAMSKQEGCLPDGPAMGPFKTHKEALKDAQENRE